MEILFYPLRLTLTTRIELLWEREWNVLAVILKLNLIKKQIKDREKIEPCAKISKKRLCRKSLNCFEIFAH